jgi:transcriptional regulator with XRE-family HTH domain
MTLREHRLRRGLSLEATAYLSGVHESTVSRVERHKVDPDPETVVKLAKGYGVSVRRFHELLTASTKKTGQAPEVAAAPDEVSGAA